MESTPRYSAGVQPVLPANSPNTLPCPDAGATSNWCTTCSHRFRFFAAHSTVPTNRFGHRSEHANTVAALCILDEAPNSKHTAALLTPHTTVGDTDACGSDQRERGRPSHARWRHPHRRQADGAAQLRRDAAATLSASLLHPRAHGGRTGRHAGQERASSAADTGQGRFSVTGPRPVSQLHESLEFRFRRWRTHHWIDYERS